MKKIKFFSNFLSVFVLSSLLFSCATDASDVSDDISDNNQTQTQSPDTPIEKPVDNKTQAKIDLYKSLLGRYEINIFYAEDNFSSYNSNANSYVTNVKHYIYNYSTLVKDREDEYVKDNIRNYKEEYYVELYEDKIINSLLSNSELIFDITKDLYYWNELDLPVLSDEEKSNILFQAETSAILVIRLGDSTQEVYDGTGTNIYPRKNYFYIGSDKNGNLFMGNFCDVYSYELVDRVYDYESDTWTDKMELCYKKCNFAFERSLCKHFLQYNLVKKFSPSEINTDNGSSSSGSSSTSDNSFEASGTYEFTTAKAPQINGSVTLNNGKWTYSGEKTNAAAKEGTYSVSGSTITVNWTVTAGGQSIDFSDKFTVTISGSDCTWKCDNAVSDFLGMLFGVSGQEIIFSKS